MYPMHQLKSGCPVILEGTDVYLMRVVYTPEEETLFKVVVSLNNNHEYVKELHFNSLYAAWYYTRKGRRPDNFTDIDKGTARLLFSDDMEYWDMPYKNTFAKVFLVEDHTGEYDYSAYFFTEYGASVTTFRDLDEALGWCQNAEKAILTADAMEEGADV